MAIPLALPRPDQVHLWLGRTGDARAHLAGFARALSDEERRRRDAFRSPLHAEAFVVARGLLRLLLARYLGGRPDAVALTCGPHGKPRLADAPADSALRFNLAHARDALILAFSTGMDVGVDVEWVDANTDVMALAGTVLRAAEIDRLGRLAGHERTRLFFRYWTRKEAYLKALGVGLAGDMVTLDVSGSAPAGAAGLIDHAPGRGDPAWTVRDVAFAADFAAAVAVPHRSPDLVMRRLTAWPEC